MNLFERAHLEIKKVFYTINNGELNHIFWSYIESIGYALSNIVIVAFLLYIIQLFLYKVVIRKPKTILFTAWIGTPIHELSHLVMCPFFLHKVEKVSFFSPKQDGTLGYVQHSYRHTIWRIVGLFFIGMAPLAGGAMALTAITFIWNENKAEEFFYISQQFNHNLDYSNYLKNTLEFTERSVKWLSSIDWLSPINWLWLYLCTCISCHLMPSKADFKGAFVGFVCLLLCGFAVCLFWGNGYNALLKTIKETSILISMMLSLSILISVAYCLLLTLINNICTFKLQNNQVQGNIYH